MRYHHKRRVRGALLTSIVASLVVGVTGAPPSGGAAVSAADTSAVRASATSPPTSADASFPDDPVDLFASPYGLLRYDTSANCGAGVEVAYVADRVIVQTAQPEKVRTAINTWLSKQPKPLDGVGTALALRRATGSSGSEAVLVDSIVLPAPNPDVEALAPIRAYDLPGAGPYDVVDLARWLVTSLGVPAAPDYALRFQGHDFHMPNGIPVATDAVPVVRGPFGGVGPALGDGVRIAVFDTGLADPGRVPNATALRAGDVEIPDVDGDGLADNGVVGHGVSISSVIASLVPGATIVNARVAIEGLGTDFTSAKRIVRVIDTLPPGSRPHLIGASFATMACDRDPDVPGDELMPVSLRGASDWVAQLSPFQPGEMAIVASAGNHGTERRAYPAAFEPVISVGALDATLDGDGDPLTSPSRTGPIAEFSGRGSWVDGYAPGAAIVATHVGAVGAGIDFGPWADPAEPTVDALIEGRAEVDGTSYAAPALMSMLAEVMADAHISVLDAWARLRATALGPQPACDGSLPGNPDAVAVVLVDQSLPIGSAPVTKPTKVC